MLLTGCYSHDSRRADRVEVEDIGPEPHLFMPCKDEASEYLACLHPAGISLPKSGYFTMPALDELAGMVSEDGSCVVKDFVIGRKGYGSVMFPGDTNIAGLDLHSIGM